MIRHVAAVAGLYLSAAWRGVWMWDLTEGIGRWRRYRRSRGRDPYWTQHRSGF